MSSMDDEEENNRDLLNTAVCVFAHYVGIDLETEKDLMWIAEEAFDKLPDNWEFGVSEDGDHAGIPYFYNSDTGESVWHHPLEAQYRRKLKKERELKAEKEAIKKDKEKDTSGSFSKDKGSKSKIEELTIVEEVEDFENTFEPPQQISKNVVKTTLALALADTRTKSERPGFGLSEDDFIDSSNLTNEKPTSLSNVSRFGANNNKGLTGADNRDKRDKLQGSTAFISSEKESDRSKTENQKETQLNSRDFAISNREKSTDNNSSSTNSNGDRWFRLHSEGAVNSNSNSRDNSALRGERDRESDRDRDRSDSRGRGKTSVSFRDESVDKSRDSDRDRDRDRDREQRHIKDSRDIRDLKSQNRPSQGNESGLSANFLSVATDHLDKVVESLRQEREKLLDELSLQRRSHQAELMQLREDVRAAEAKLTDEKRDRKEMEDRLLRAQGEAGSRQREVEDIADIKMREALRKQRDELDEDHREKIRFVERKASEEQESLRNEIVLSRRKLDEALREIDNLKRKLSLSKEDGRLEIMSEIEALRESLREAEDSDRRRQGELRKAREEAQALQTRVAQAMQAAQVSAAELEAARLQASAQGQEVITQAASLAQATQRMMGLELELAQTRAEISMIRKDKDTADLELRRLRSVQGVGNEALQFTETEAKRAKASAQAEISRLSTKCAEMEALNNVLRSEIDKALSTEAAANRQATANTDMLAAEISRLKERVVDATVREEELLSRIRQQEKDILSQQETIFRLQRAAKDESQLSETLREAISAARKEGEEQINILKRSIETLQEKKQLLQRRHEEMLQQTQREVAERVPRLVDAAIGRAEKDWNDNLQTQLSEMKAGYEATLARKKQELLEIQASYSEREVSRRMQGAEERIELEKLRQAYKNNLLTLEEQENSLRELRRQLRVFEGFIPLQQQNMTQLMSVQLPPHQIPETFNHSRPSSSFEAKPSFLQSYDAGRGTESFAEGSSTWPSKSMSKYQEAEALGYLSQQLSFLKQTLTGTLSTGQKQREGAELYSDFPNRSLVSLAAEEMKDTQASSKIYRKNVAFDESILQSPTTRRISPNNRKPDEEITGWTAKDELQPAEFSTFEPLPTSQLKGSTKFESRDASILSLSMDSYYIPKEASLSTNRLRYSQIESLLDIPDVGAKDGGYHEGYWRTKYAKR